MHHAGTEMFLGVDVGTASARCSLFSNNGKFIVSMAKKITIWNEETGIYEQSSEEIWNVCLELIKFCASQTQSSRIQGIGFTATCSLVVLDEAFKPITVSKSGVNDRNIIMWMDHRAGLEAKFINETKHSALNQVGQSISLEMQPPKLLWLKKNLPHTWKNAAHFFDLPDYLTFRATNSLSRSLCSVVCKWLYKVDSDVQHSWNLSFMRAVGLDDLARNDFAAVGNEVLKPGDAVKNGLAADVAQQLNLTAGIAVAVSVIDAHAGGIGLMGCRSLADDLPHVPAENTLALICGSSTCHMAVSHTPRQVNGIWGPYYSAMLPGMYLNEGGQSATGLAIDYVLRNSGGYIDAKVAADKAEMTLPSYLEERLKQRSATRGCEISELTHHLHVYPDFHGNRSPLADPNLAGMVCGLRLEDESNSIELLYLATLQALAYSSRHILDELQQNGYQFKVVVADGGLRHHPLYLQMHADVLGLPVIVPDNENSVSLGAAMLAASAAKAYASLEEAMKEMSGTGQCIQPCKKLSAFHERKFRIYHELLRCQKRITQL